MISGKYKIIEDGILFRIDEYFMYFAHSNEYIKRIRPNKFHTLHKTDLYYHCNNLWDVRQQSGFTPKEMEIKKKFGLK